MAMLTRLDPFRDLARLQDEMSRLFEDRLYRSGESVGWTPSCDIYEDQDGVTLRFENGVLTIRGELLDDGPPLLLRVDGVGEHVAQVGGRIHGQPERLEALRPRLDPTGLDGEAEQRLGVSPGN